MKATKESDVLSACLQYLALRGCFCWRNNTGAFAGEYKGRKRFVRYGLKGSSDILGVMPGGRLIAVETKRPKGGKLSPEQAAFIDAVNRAGGLAVCVSDVAQLAAALQVEGVL